MSDALGNVFEAVDEAEAAGASGPDFRTEVEVRRSALGDDDGVVVPVPAFEQIDGQRVPRKPGPGDEPDRVRLHLPQALADGVALRLRGQGGASPDGGRAGDLLVTIRIVEDPPTRRPPWVLMLVAVLAGLAVWWLASMLAPR